MAQETASNRVRPDESLTRIAILEEEARRLGASAGAARVFHEIGRLWEESQGNPKKAALAYRRSLQMDPTFLPNLRATRRLFSRKGGWHLALQLLEREIEATVGQGELAGLLVEKGRLLLHTAREEEAIACFQEAFQVDPSHVLARKGLSDLLDRRDSHRELLAVLQVEASFHPSNALAQRISRLWLRLGDEDNALQALEEAQDQRDPLVLADLARLLERRRAWDRLARVRELQARSSADAAERISLFLDLARIYEDRLDAPMQAIQCYCEVLQHDTKHSPALSALGKLQSKVGDWEGLLATIEFEARTARSPRERMAYDFKAAKLLEERLDRPAIAMERYGAIFRTLPSYLPALRALWRLGERLERWEDLLRLLSEAASSFEDPEDVVATLIQIAEVQEERIGDPSAAIRTYLAILDLAPDRLDAIRGLGRVAEQSSDWKTLTKALKLEADRTEDQHAVLELLHRRCEILEERLDDKEMAIEAYRNLLALQPSYTPALRSLGRLYAQRGRWEELIRMHRREAEVSSTKHGAAALLYNIGELLEQKLCDEERAVTAYRQVLALVSDHFPALGRLAAIYRNQNAWAELVDVLEKEAAFRTEPVCKALRLYEAARISEEEIGDLTQATRRYQAVLDLDGENVSALRALERVFGKQGRNQERAEVLSRLADRVAPGEQADLLVFLASLQPRNGR